MQKEKIVQALIEAINDIADKVVSANDLAKDYKAKFQAAGVDLDGTGLTQVQVDALMAWLTAINAVATDAVVTVARNKQQQTHGTKALG